MLVTVVVVFSTTILSFQHCVSLERARPSLGYKILPFILLAMKVLKANAGPLTNFEVLDFLRSRGAAKDPTRVIASISPSEFNVYDYLVDTAASAQTRESIQEFMKRSESFDLAKAEKLNITNIRPSPRVEIDPIIEKETEGKGEEVVERMEEEVYEELVNMVVEVLPAQEKPEGTDQDDQEPVEEN